MGNIATRIQRADSEYEPIGVSSAGPVAITGSHRRRLSRETQEMNDVDGMLIGTPEDDGLLHDIDEERTVRCGVGFASLSQLNLLQLEIDAERLERAGPHSPTGHPGGSANDDGEGGGGGTTSSRAPPPRVTC